MEALNKTRQILCPSNECKEGAILVGIVQKDGRVGFLNQKVHINNEFVQIAHTGRSPEKRFRFASKCLNDDCENWTNGGYGVIQAVIDSIGPICEPSVTSRLFYQTGLQMVSTMWRTCMCCMSSDNYRFTPE